MQRIILLLVLLVVAFAKPMIEPNKQELCQCGVFDDEKIAADEKPLMTRQLTTEISCSEPKAKDHCKHLCIVEAKVEEGNAAGYLCGKLKGKHGDHVKITLFYKACDLTQWLYTGHSAYICCHEGECAVNCTGETTDTSCFATNSTKAKPRELLSDSKPAETPTTGVIFPTPKPSTIDVIPFPKAAAAVESEQNVPTLKQTAQSEVAKPEPGAKNETCEAVSVPNAAAAAGTEQKGPSAKQTTVAKSDKSAPAAKKATGGKTLTPKAPMAASAGSLLSVLKKAAAVVAGAVAPAPKPVTSQVVAVPKAAAAAVTKQKVPAQKQTGKAKTGKTAPASGGALSVPKKETGADLPTTKEPKTVSERPPLSVLKQGTSTVAGTIVTVPTTLPTGVAHPDSKNSTTPETRVTVPAPKKE